MTPTENKEAPKPISEQPKITRHSLTEGLRSQIKFEKTWMDEIADFCTATFGSVWFLLVNAFVFTVWIILNIPEFGFVPFDPFPFGLLTMAVSLEAIFLSIIVLISQNRQGRIADIRQRVNFEVDVRAEDEITKILKMLGEIQEHLGIKKKDAELARMEKKTDIEKIQKTVESET
ncbi:DUF1003 domain-containing protein [Patescibacteria group bacterium]|nr:DUF1003 domain-containing protein [Patescibacteria group bacterium]